MQALPEDAAAQEVRPFLKWTGGKQRLLPQLIPLLPPLEEVHTYIEPFAGSAALFFALEFDAGDRIVLNDKNEALVNVYRCLLHWPSNTIKALEQMARRHRKDPAGTYKLLRDQFNAGIADDATRAATALYLNRTCFNGVWRVNRAGEFNVPMGAYDHEKLVICNYHTLISASERLKAVAVEITNADFALTLYALHGAPSKAFVYFDPPYVPVSATADFTGYTADKFDENDLLRLKRCCNLINEVGQYFMVSNSDTALARSTFKDYRIDTISRRGNINSDVSKRGDVRELVIRNY